MLFSLLSCIGKVEDANSEKSLNAESGSNAISFSGLTKVIPIAHDKVELYFYPAAGASSSFTYLIYINDSIVPIEVKADSLMLTDSGLYLFTVTGLDVASEYTFSVGVRDANTGSESANDTTLITRTFGNYTADFAGISAVEVVAGEGGQNSVTVKWVPATTLGSTFNAMPGDPVAYTISYIADEDGGVNDLIADTHSSIIRDQNPSSLSASPSGTTERERIISGLSPGKKYYFRVRAIHKAYATYGEIEGYKTEENNNILSVETISSGGLFDWNINSLVVTTPGEDDGLSKVDFSWASATGPFVGYRLYNEKIAEATESMTDAETSSSAAPVDNTYINNLNSSSTYVSLNADDLSYTAINLDSYAYYRSFLVACRTLACGDSERIVGSTLIHRVVPKMASFSGLLSVNSPQDVDKLDELKLVFDAPVIETGYLNDFDIYCYDSLSDTSPTILQYNTANTSGKSGCDGLTRLEDNPTYSGFGNLTEITIQGDYFDDGESVADREYCFSAVPKITGTNYSNSDLDNAIIRCTTPIIAVPTIDEFPGADTSNCSTSTSTIDVTWTAPEVGIYENYVLFYKEDDGTEFKFTDAVDGNASYTRVDSLTGTSYTINSLVPGKTYQYGVLTYVTIGASTVYSEYNVGIGKCSIPIPTPRFEEWVDIFSVGPKADGLINPTGPNRSKTYLTETLNNSGQPIEVDVDSSTNGPTSAFEDQFGATNGSNNFNGVYGAINGVATNGIHKFSNSGIIRIAWKDVSFESDSYTLDDLVDQYETATLKRDREIGYRVYRSVDNKETWVDITSNSFSFQSISNDGLLHPDDYSERKRPNETPDVYKAVMFTDYSVSHVVNSGEMNRARVYYYKVVPVFKGRELEYEREESNPQHIIKVVLPPENMALVHRLIANRQTCLELEKDHSGDISSYYTCSWNGIGARGLQVPWVNGSTIYDFGPSMLIDRFELGCNFTRGDYGNVASRYSGANFDFVGTNDNGTNFVGCVNPNGASSAQVTTGSSHPATSASYSDRHQYRVGDCIGEEDTSIFPSSNTCGDPSTSRFRSFVAPGVPASANFSDCTQSQNVAGTYFDPYGNNSTYNGDAVQSEYAAVYYNRNTTNSVYDYSTLGNYRGAFGFFNGDGSNIVVSNPSAPSRCMINIPVQDQMPNPSGSGRLKTRWLPVNKLSSLTYGGMNVDIFDFTLNQVLADGRLYDSFNNSAPNTVYLNLTNSSRYRGTTPLAKIFSSNDSKLPPLAGLTQEQADRVCSAYTVQVGTYDDVNDVFNQIGDDRQKRLMRRTEGIVANRFPKDFDTTKISDLETGSLSEDPVTSGSTFSAGCNVYERDIVSGESVSNSISGEMYSTLFPSYLQGSAPNNQVRPPFITGSSFYDKDGQNNSSQSCVSRFGLQDIIGNMAEFSSDQYYCNFSGEQLMLGGGSASNSVNIPNASTYDSALTAWVQSSPDTGRCSVSEQGSSRTNNHSVSGSQVTIYDIYGNINTNLIGQTNLLDSSFVGFLRNGGDGYFFDFGQSNFAPPLSDNDTIALFWDDNVKARDRDSATDPRRGRYFNPIIGMPLECQGSICNSSDDNKLITTDDFVSSFSLDPANFNISDFPVGNSQIYSDGMSEITIHNSLYQSPDTFSYTYDFIQSVDTSTGTTTRYTDNNGGSEKSSLDNDGTVANQVWWRVNRERLNIQNFGSSKLENSGRYSAYIRGLGVQSENVLTNVGVRCAVRLEDSLE